MKIVIIGLLVLLGFRTSSVGKDANRGGLGVTSVLFGNGCFSNTNNGGKIFGEVLSYKDKIYFNAFSDNTNITCCLDINTGKLLKKYPEIKADSLIDGYFLYNLYNQKITILNLETDEISVYDISSVLHSAGIKDLVLEKLAVKDGQIVIGQNRSAEKNNLVGGAELIMLSKDFTIIEWTYKLPAECGTIGTIVLSETRLFVHTQNNTLFVFEKSPTL